MIDKTNTWICRWLAFLAITIDFSFSKVSFKTRDTPLTAKEGSCIEIHCETTLAPPKDDQNKDVWYWIKNPKYNDEKKSFDGTIVYNNKNESSEEFAHRVEYKGPYKVFERNSLCSIIINDLQKTDSGNYSFRFDRPSSDVKWRTTPEVNLTVEENPCKITFEEPPVMKESDFITLQCSTSSSCHEHPKFKELQKEQQVPTPSPTAKITTVSFTADWQDDGKMLTCYAPGYTDDCLARSFSLIVEYAPRETKAYKSPEDVREGQNVILTCSARGRPNPTFSWFKDGQKKVEGNAEWRIDRIQASDSGSYHCQAENNHGSNTSAQIPIDVKYRPVGVEVKMKNPSDVREEDSLTLNCAVNRSNPEPWRYTWQKNNEVVEWQKSYVVKNIQPENSGSYTCSATNSTDQGTLMFPAVSPAKM